MAMSKWPGTWWGFILFYLCIPIAVSLAGAWLFLREQAPIKPRPEYPMVIHIVESNHKVLAIYAEKWKDPNDISSSTSFELLWPEPEIYYRKAKVKKSIPINHKYFRVGYWKEYQPK
jgi:hypothetical protein